jgi:membrane peptidoglycan carboxypeptidase
MTSGPDTDPAGPKAARPRRKFLGEMLVRNGVITQQQLEEALAIQKNNRGARLGRLFLDLGYATEARPTTSASPRCRRRRARRS